MKLTQGGEMTVSAAEPIYFGWRVVAAMFIVTMMVIGTTIYGFIILGDPLAAQFGWSAAQTGSLVSALWILAPLALFVAPVINKVGPVRLIVLGLVLQGLAFAAVSQITEFWQLYLLRLVMGLGKIACLVSVPVVVCRWFSRRFSTAMALAWCGGSFGGLLLSPVAETLNTRLGWGGAALALGGMMIAAAGLVFLLCLGRQSPAELGLGLDGERLSDQRTTTGEDRQSEAPMASGREVLRSIRLSTALMMAVGILFTGASAIAMLSRTPALLESGGVAPGLAATLFGLMSGAAATGQIIVGWFLDRVRVSRINLVIALTLVIGAGCLALLQEQYVLAIAVIAPVAWGLGMGANEMLWITLTKRQFGTAAFAFTYGGWSCALQAGYALGGPIGGWAFDHGNASTFPLLVGLFYLPAVIFAVWRPGVRNEA